MSWAKNYNEVRQAVRARSNFEHSTCWGEWMEVDMVGFFVERAIWDKPSHDRAMRIIDGADGEIYALFSDQTCVAVASSSDSVVADRKWSATTSRQQWIFGACL